MKKMQLVSLALSAVLLLSACKADNSPTQAATEPPVTEAPTAPVIPPDITVVNENMYSVALPVSTDEFYTEEKILLHSHYYQTMYLHLQDRDVADRIIMDFESRIEKSKTVSKEILALAENHYNPENNFSPYSYEIQYNVTRIDQGILSLFGHEVQIGDMPRANRKLISVNYDLVTGDVLTVGSILYHLDTKDDLAALAISNLEKREDIRLFDDFRNTVTARFNRDESIDEDFYFSENGLCFYFAPNEIAPRSYDIIVVEIPYNELTGIIADPYFPPERSYTYGEINIHKFSEKDYNSYQQFVDVIANDDGMKVLLTTPTAVQDIRIFELIWTEDGVAYTQEKNIYASNFLSSDNAILLDAEFRSFRPSYVITYSVNGQTQRYYTIMNAETGEISLATSY